MDHSGRLGAIFRQIENIENHDESSVVLKGMLDKVIARCQQAKESLEARDQAALDSIEPTSPEVGVTSKQDAE